MLAPMDRESEDRAYWDSAEEGAELVSEGDYAAAVAFYQRVFGWDTKVVSDTDDFRYTMLVEGENQLAGIMDASAMLPEGVPSHWGVYFAVTDTDATIAKAVAAGATVVSPAMDTPYGRLASLTDPTGALFKLGSLT